MAIMKQHVLFITVGPSYLQHVSFITVGPSYLQHVSFITVGPSYLQHVSFITVGHSYLQHVLFITEGPSYLNMSFGLVCTRYIQCLKHFYFSLYRCNLYIVGKKYLFLRRSVYFCNFQFFFLVQCKLSENRKRFY